MSELLIGKVTHYFSKAHVAAIEVTEGDLHVGDTIHVVGHTSDYMRQIQSMQKEHAAVAEAHAGENIGVQFPEHVREHDIVYKVVPD